MTIHALTARLLSQRSLLPLFGIACLILATRAQAVQLGVLGDSLSDEYAEESYGAYAENWVEQLVLHGGIDVGPTASQAGQPGGTWGEPRRTGYETNWARSGADSGTLLSGGQHTGLASQVVSQGITYAVLAIGANDFAPDGTAYASIYFGAWSAAQIDAYVSQRVANVEAALDVLLPTGVQLALVNFPDYGVAPTVQSFFPDAARRQLVADVIQQVNTALDAVAQARQLPIADLFGAAVAIFGPHGSSNSSLTVGNVVIDLLQTDTPGGGNPTAGFVHDGIHPNTTVQGVMANTFIEALNVAYGANLVLFSEQQILGHRGLAYGGSDTLTAQLGEYVDYVSNHASIPACGDGFDNDGDGSVDFPEDPGCGSSQDLSEHSQALVCDDGIDNDGDGLPDAPADPGCRDSVAPREDPECNDGLDNDGDGAIDFPSDLQCAAAWDSREARGRRCALGFEVAILLSVLGRMRANRAATAARRSDRLRGARLTRA